MRMKVSNSLFLAFVFLDFHQFLVQSCGVPELTPPKEPVLAQVRLNRPPEYFHEKKSGSSNVGNGTTNASTNTGPTILKPMSIQLIMDPAFNLLDPVDKKDVMFALSKMERIFRNLLKVKEVSDIVIKDHKRPDCPPAGTYSFTDFVVKINLKDAGLCSPGSSMIAYAVHCDQSDLDYRPVSAQMGVCKHHLVTSRKPRDLSSLVNTFVHELTHALVFHNYLFRYFRDHEGYAYDIDQDQGDADTGLVPGVTDVVQRTNWLTAGGVVPVTKTILITPKVVEFARQHFNCPTLDGVELENQGEPATRYLHWESRILEIESMTGVSTELHAFSNFSLALYEDSGWYVVDRSKAQEIFYGKNAGCTFATNSCYAYVMEQRKKGLPPFPFCTKDGQAMCSADRDVAMKCKFGRLESSAAPEFNYFRKPDGKYPQSNPMDGCPYAAAITNGHVTSKCYGMTSRLFYGDSENEKISLQVFSDESKCMLIQGKVTREKDGKRTMFDVGAGCFKYKCMDNTLFIKTYRGKYYPCYKKNQIVNVDKKIYGKGRSHFKIVCPACEELCSSCNATAPNNDMIGDKPADKKDILSIFNSPAVRRELIAVFVFMIIIAL